MLIHLSKREYEILKNADISEIYEEGGSIEFLEETYSINISKGREDDEISLLVGVLTDEMSRNGFDENYEPTGYGRSVEGFMDRLVWEYRDKYPLTGHLREQMDK